MNMKTKYVLSFDASYYNKLDLDVMTEEERWQLAWQCMGIGADEAQIVTLDEWVRMYNEGNVPEGGSLLIYLVEKDDDALGQNLCPSSVGEDNTKEEVNTDVAWLFYDEVAEPQVKQYIKDYDGDMSVFWYGDNKSFWYEVWIDLQEDWLSGEKLYLQCKDMDLREIGKFLFEKLCKYEAYYDSPQWIEDLNKMAAVLA